MKKKALLHSKLASQIALAFLSILLIAEGLWGSQFAPKNLTTLLVWVHYRGLLVFLLVVWGNAFCLGCPFILVRNAARVFISPKYLWPKKLQNKWIGIFLFVAILFFYEYLSLWADPKKTALVIIIFFLSALMVDLIFKHASFCKYLCPIGQFNFLASSVSPQEVKAININTCLECKTLDCLKGNKTSTEINKRGCELLLLIPKKVGNLDCTFCLDCIDACPHDNIEIASRLPTSELWEDSHRSGVGSFSNRFDLLVFIIIFTFGALLNAFSMVAPAVVIDQFLKNYFNLQSEFLLLLVQFVLFLILLPLIILPKKNKVLIPSLIPLGFSIWIAHYSFHLLTGIFTFVPLLTKMTIPIHLMGAPLSIVTPIQYGVLFLGTLLSITTLLKMTEQKMERIKWVTSFLIIAFLALWIMSLPMQMRGTFLG